MRLRLRTIWYGIGSDSFVIGLVGYRDRTARLFLGVSILMTTTIAVVGAALFAFTVVGTGGGWLSVFAVTLTCVVYGLMIYMLDMSIVTAVRPRMLQVAARILLAAFLSFIVGSQINVAIHRDLLTSALQAKLEREEGGRIAKERAEAEQLLNRAEFFHKQQIDEVREVNERIVLFSGITPEQRSRWAETVSELRLAEDALNILVCARPLEARGEPWERRCGIVQTNPLLGHVAAPRNPRKRPGGGLPAPVFGGCVPHGTRHRGNEDIDRGPQARTRRARTGSRPSQSGGATRQRSDEPATASGSEGRNRG
jgi:hypothetical protein